MNHSKNFFEERIASCSYPGRGLVLGLSSDGTKALQVYWIMGRSENSRNRIFHIQGGRVFTEAADPAKLEDPSLIIYDAMLEHDRDFIVTNGDQTRTVREHLLKGSSFETALLSRSREPDAPNFTPRISGMTSLSEENRPLYRISVIRANQADPERSDHHFYCVPEIAPGSGLCVTTYLGDGSPLPSFRGEPFPVDLSGSPEDILQRYWAALDEGNRVSLALKVIDLENATSHTLIQNRHTVSGA
ncbi:MAG: inosine monophosphate cyclohydrolase [Planctomycetes bacterium]|nr:inosine monophosphate cyclohydrolase [Planctomycetota bacterium]